MSQLCSAAHGVHMVVSQASAVLNIGAAVGRRAGRTVILAASTLTLREGRETIAPLLTLDELAICDAAFNIDCATDEWWEGPIFTPASLAHPTVGALTIDDEPATGERERADSLAPQRRSLRSIRH